MWAESEDCRRSRPLPVLCLRGPGGLVPGPSAGRPVATLTSPLSRRSTRSTTRLPARPSTADPVGNGLRRRCDARPSRGPVQGLPSRAEGVRRAGDGARDVRALGAPGREEGRASRRRRAQSGVRGRRAAAAGRLVVGIMGLGVCWALVWGRKAFRGWPFLGDRPLHHAFGVSTFVPRHRRAPRPGPPSGPRTRGEEVTSLSGPSL